MGRLIEGGIYSSAPGAEITGDPNNGQKTNNPPEEQEKSKGEQEIRYKLQNDFFNRIFGLYHVDRRDVDGRLAITHLLGADVKTYTLYEARVEEKYRTFPEFKVKPTDNSSAPKTQDLKDENHTEKDRIKKAVLKSQFRRLHITDPSEQEKFKEILGAEISTLVWTGHRIQEKIDSDRVFAPYRQNLLKHAEEKADNQPKLKLVVDKKNEQIQTIPITILNRHGDLPQSVSSAHHN